jgi:hypothetical protein
MVARHLQEEAVTVEERIREALAGHQLANYSRERYCLCGTFLGDWADEATTAAHQASVVAGIAREAQAQGLRDAANEAMDHEVGMDSKAERERQDRGFMQRHNVRAAANWLRARADRIEGEGA